MAELYQMPCRIIVLKNWQAQDLRFNVQPHKM